MKRVEGVNSCLNSFHQNNTRFCLGSLLSRNWQHVCPAAYCPGRMAEYPKTMSTGGFYRLEWSPCRSPQYWQPQSFRLLDLILGIYTSRDQRQRLLLTRESLVLCRRCFQGGMVEMHLCKIDQLLLTNQPFLACISSTARNSLLRLIVPIMMPKVNLQIGGKIPG